MKKISITLLILLNILYFSTAQDSIKQKNNILTKEKIEKAKKIEQKADRLFFSDYIQDALDGYLESYKLNSTSASINYKIGVCYYLFTDGKKASEFLKTAYDNDSLITPEIHYFLARSLHISYQFDSAIAEYKRYKHQLKNDEQKIEKLNEIDKHIKECMYGKKLYERPEMVALAHIDEVNTIYPEYSPYINFDNTMMVFTSRNEQSLGSLKDPKDNLYYEDVYISYRNKNDSTWSKPENIGPKINTKTHDATVGISPDGSTIFIFSDKNGGDIFFTEKQAKKGKWTKLKPFKQINSEYHESSISISGSGDTIYFVSDRPEGNIGGQDIFYCIRQKDGKWSSPKNLGDKINTPLNEEGVFVDPDGKSLYFSSKGHTTMGGYDIFRSTRTETGEWSVPENMGYPINTPNDDVFFSIADTTGYYSSLRGEGLHNYEIIEVIFWEEIEEYTEIVLIDSSYTEITEKDTLLTNLKDTLTLTQKDTTKLIVADNNPLAEPEKNEITKPDTTTLITEEKVLEKFESILFEFDKSFIKNEYYTVLSNLKDYLVQNPDYKVKIVGHTDNTGNKTYNQKLSKQRAFAVKKYLIYHKIDENKIIIEALGYSKPAADNSTTEGRKRNRRVEIFILR